MLLSLVALAGAPHSSLTQIVSANGYGAVVWSGDRVSDAWPRLYQMRDAEDDETEDLLYDSYGGVTDYEGAGHWFTDPDSVEVLDGTGIIVSTYVHDDLELTQYTFAPLDLGYFGVAQVYQLRNLSTSTPTSATQFVSLHNWQPGSGESVNSDSPERVSEEGDDYAVFYRAPDADTVTCEEGYDQVVAGRRIVGECGGYGSDNVPVFGWSTPSLSPGEEVWYSTLVGIDVDLVWMADRSPQDWVLDEVVRWSEIQAVSPAPTELSAEEAIVWRQQIAWLHMAQVREEGDTYGQIAASLPAVGPVVDFDHVWNITWVRDSAYAIVASAKVGRVDAASDALRFLIQDGKSGLYSSYISDVNYSVSVCRLYGDGSEWSDDDGTGPNIELDNWGSFLWALGETVEVAPDDTLLQELGPIALDGVAYALIALTDEDNGLIVADSSIWERHWNGNQKQYAYTSIQAYAGLRAAADIAERLGDSRASGFTVAADALQAAIATHLVDNDGVVAQSVEELAQGYGYLDVAVAEAWNQGVLDPKGRELTATVAMWDTWLRAPSGNGYMRNDDALSTYDTAHWAFVDLRASMALRRACRISEADALFDYVTQQALLNHGVIPELYDPTTDDYAGPAPMLGFGAGAWLLAAQERAELDAACGEDSGVPDDTGPTDTAGETGKEPPGDRCGCVSSPVGPALAMTWSALLWTWARGRRSGRRPTPIHPKSGAPVSKR